MSEEAVIFNLALKRQEKKLSEMRAWSENPTNYRNTIIRAFAKLRQIEGDDSAMNFLDEIIAGKVRA